MLFALNPMVVFYGANGMSEAPFLFCLCTSIRRLIRWIRTDDAHDLAASGSGIALALAYLTRYDALAPAAAAAALVVVISYRRNRGQRFARYAAAMDFVLITAPVVLAFAVWTATSWLITGEAFQQFSSQYGNSSIITQSGDTATVALAQSMGFSTAATLILGPALPLLVPIAAAFAVRRRDAQVLVPLLLCGAVIGFQAYAHSRGETFGFLRFYIAAIPLAAILAIQIAPTRGRLHSRRPGRHAAATSAVIMRVPTVAMVAVLLASAISLPLTAWGMTSARMAPQEYALGAIVRPNPDDPSDRASKQRRIIASFGTERRLANYLDSLHLPRGSILMDTVFGFAVVVASHQPDQFVTPSDRDFVDLLNRPAAYSVRYLLAVPNTGRGRTDALNRRYPTLYDTGADIATLALEIPNDGADQPCWRLYRVN